MRNVQEAEAALDVVLSHRRADREKVGRLAARLRALGLAVGFEAGIGTAHVLVLCLSAASREAGDLALERASALFRDPELPGRRFVPLLLAGGVLPESLRGYQAIDFRQESEEAFAALASLCRAGSPSPLADDPVEVASLVRTLRGHQGAISSVAFGPDGGQLVSGSRDGRVKIWDSARFRCRTTLEERRGRVEVALTPDGERLLSLSDDQTIRVYDAKTHFGQCTIYEPWLLGMATMPDSIRLLTCAGGSSPALRLWDLRGGKRLMTLLGHGDAITSVVAAGPSLAFSGSFDQTARLWDVDKGLCVFTFKGHSSRIKTVAVTPDGRHGFSGSKDRTILVWDLLQGHCVGILEGHQKEVDALAVSADGAWLVSVSSSERSLRLWDWRAGACLQTLTPPEGLAPMAIAMSAEQRHLAVGTNGGKILIYKLAPRVERPAAEVARRYVNAKVVLLGEATVGKTSLAHRLIHDEYVIHDRTHGMSVWRLDLPLEDDAALEREALLWDLAGQEDYRLIHQLFLEETALALLLVRPQTDDPFTDALAWLKALGAATAARDPAREVAKVLIPSQLDSGGLKVSQRKIDRFLEEQGFLACLPTSAKEGLHCSDRENGGRPSALKELIARSIPWHALPWTSTPRLLAELKKAVTALRDEADIRLLRFAELAQRVENGLPAERIDVSDLRTALTLLANHGLVKLLAFGDLVLLRPDLLNGYAAAIIRAAQRHKDEIGCVSEAAIYREDFDLTGVDRLRHRADEELLLRALVQILIDSSLCIRESEGGEWLLVFPSQYRRERDIPGHPEIFVSYLFSGEVATVYTTLVVRAWYSGTFSGKELWKDAAEFATGQGRVVGVVLEKLGDGQGKLSIFFEEGVPDGLKVVFLEFVHQHLSRYGRDLRRERRYFCSNRRCGRPFRDQELIGELLAEGAKTIICQRCRTEVELIDFIEQCRGTDRVAQQVVEMDVKERAGRDSQALEQILIGHTQAICGEANQIFRELDKFDYGIDGEVEFKNDAGQASGRKIYLQLKSGGSYLRHRKSDGKEIFDVKNERHLEYWQSQPCDVYLIIRDAQENIRWMNLTRYLENRPEKSSRQIVFEGEKLDPWALWRVRDQLLG